jgi:hypothetical protein
MFGSIWKLASSISLSVRSWRNAIAQMTPPVVLLLHRFGSPSNNLQPEIVVCDGEPLYCGWEFGIFA